MARRAWHTHEMDAGQVVGRVYPKCFRIAVAAAQLDYGGANLPCGEHVLFSDDDVLCSAGVTHSALSVASMCAATI